MSPFVLHNSDLYVRKSKCIYTLLYNHYKIITLFVRYQKNLSESSDGNYSIRIEILSFSIFFHHTEKYV